MARERRAGPVAMADDELAAFLAGSPTGAVCVVDDDGDLLALPARVVDFEDTAITFEVDGAHPDGTLSRPAQACLVADIFTAYRDIRGVIAQGTVAWPPVSQDVAQLAITRTVTFSFANA